MAGGMINATITGDTVTEDLISQAQKLYPNKAGTTQLHHIFPEYLGGAADGALAPKGHNELAQN